MNVKNLNILQLHNALVKGEITIEKLTNDLINLAKKESNSNFLVTLPEKEIKDRMKVQNLKFNDNDFLFGIPYMAKDNFATKKIRTTASSKILDNFIPTYDATVIEMLNNQNAIMIGKTALDELGMGGTGLYSAYGIITNPRDKKRIIGGSSSGSAYAVAKGIVPFALGSDTGDSIRKPASYNGIVGFKPTYGAISRYGIFPYAPSLDHAGFLARNVDDIAILSDATFGFDQKDFTSIDIENKDFYKNINNLPNDTKFAYIKDIHNDLDNNLKKEYELFFNKLKEKGYKVEAIDFKKELLEALLPTYMMISYPEAVSTIANLDGINFGQRVDGSDYVDIMTKTRSKYLGDLVKSRFIIGSLNLKKEYQDLYFNKAKKVRRLIVNEVNDIFKKYEILILPAAPSVAPLISELDNLKDKKNAYLEDVLTIANFTGIPSISVPFIEVNNLPIGINFNSAIKNDLKVLQAAKIAQNIIGLNDKVVD